VHRGRESIVADRQPVADVTDDVDTAVIDAVGIAPAGRDAPAAPQ
jgi:hypothetical protein